MVDTVQVDAAQVDAVQVDAAEPGAGVVDADFAAAHDALLADTTLQFKFETIRAPEPPGEAPAWLRAIGEFLATLAPFMSLIFWAGVAILVGFVLFIIGREALRRLPVKAKVGLAPEAEAPRPQFRPQQARARALLEEADRLAREGRFGEAARVLLHRSIEDLEAAFPGAIGLAMTSREISRIEPLSEKGRDVFSLIAQAVERSLFGGAELNEEQYAHCRGAYQSFALGGSRA
jgi:hypothetical protein